MLKSGTVNSSPLVSIKVPKPVLFSVCMGADISWLVLLPLMLSVKLLFGTEECVTDCEAFDTKVRDMIADLAVTSRTRVYGAHREISWRS